MRFKKLKPYCNDDCVILFFRFATPQNNAIVVTNQLQSIFGILSFFACCQICWQEILDGASEIMKLRQKFMRNLAALQNLMDKIV